MPGDVGEHDSASRSAAVTSLRKVLLVGGVSIAIAAGSLITGVLIARRTTSGTEMHAPRPSLLTAKVESRTVVATLSGRATIDVARRTSVMAPPAGGRVTHVGVTVGSSIDEGTVVVEVDGRPTIALRGDLPMYRALTVGSRGDDVRELEQGLQRLGLLTGVVDDVFDDQTAAAVRGLYERSGYDPIEPTPEQQAGYSTALEAVTQARLKVLTDQHAVDLDQAGLTASDRATLEQAVTVAELAETKAIRDAAALGDTLDATATARQRDVDEAEATLDGLQAQLDGLDVNAPESVRAGLGAQIEAARGRAAVATEARGTAQRERPDRAADALALVVSARGAANSARLQLADALVSKDRPLLVASLEVSKQALLAAEARLADQAAIVGTGIGVSELVFVPEFPQRVERVDATVGSEVGGPLVTLTSGAPVGRWPVVGDESGQVRVGTPVTLSDTASGTQLHGRVSELQTGADAATGVTPATPGAEKVSEVPANDPVAIVALDDQSTTLAMTEGLAGNEVIVSAELSARDVGLAVPLAAIISRADGAAVVQKAVGDDHVDVAVRVVVSGAGFARVDPTDPGTLLEGDRVVLGE